MKKKILVVKIVVIIICLLFFTFSITTLKTDNNSIKSFISENTQSYLPVFPGAEGFGTNTRAAYAGDIEPVVYKVTNLNENGPGSLRKALTASEPRIVVFEVSGYINLSPDKNDSRFSLFIKNPYLYVAGQTAPSPGITIIGTIVIETHDVVFQHLRIRPGDLPSGSDYEYRDCIDAHNFVAGNIYNIVFDHLSLSWGTDELSNTWYDTKNITYQYCIFSEALHSTLHPKGRHSCALAIGPDSRNNSIHHNLFAHCAGRTPLVEPAGYTEFINNVVYNWEYVASDFIDYPYEPYVCTNPGPKFCNIIGNFYKSGPSTIDEVAILINKDKPPSKFFIHDNIGPWRTTNLMNDWDIVYGDIELKSESPTFPSSRISTQSALDTYDHVLKNAGARPQDRDLVDNRIIKEVKDRTGMIIESQKQVGGWPTLEKNYRKLNIPNNPHEDDNKNGYTNLEEWLHEYSKNVELKDTNLAPNKPVKPLGPKSILVGRLYNFETLTHDPENNQVYYLFDWGDGTNSGWIGPFNSSENIITNKSWGKNGEYIVKSKAKDIFGKQSKWSNGLLVSTNSD